MLYSILSKLFKSDEGEYHAKPGHIFISLLIMGAGMTSWFYDGWALFGSLVTALGFGLGIVILVCLAWEPINRYWDKVYLVTDILMKSNNPSIYEWAYKVFGLKMDIKQQVTIREDTPTGQGFFNTSFKKVNVDEAKMNQLANKVLYQFIKDGSLDFTEEQYGSLIPNFRNFRKQWVKDGKLVPKNKRNSRNGYRLSKKGYDVIYNFASDSIKLKNGE